jgi:diguanylate cyclase (GGDEF)-like protein
LIRTNSFITTINEVAIQLQSALDLEQVKKTLESELERRGFCCLVALTDVNGEDGEHTLINDFQTGQFISDKDCSMALTDIPTFKDLIEQRLSRYIPDMQLWSNKLLESQVGQLPCSLSRLANISEVASGAVLPLYAHQGFIGMLAIWGADIQEDDLSGLITFANQVSVIIENARFYESLKKLAEIDGLTGLLNRHTILELAEREFKRARRLHKNMTVIMIDIDRFKHINDTYGHGMGDKVLKVVADTLQQGIRKDVDSVGRYGGDEFVVVLPETSRTDGELVARRLETAVQACTISVEGNPIQVVISTGVATLTDEYSNLDGLLEIADQAMYVAKRKRNIEARG